MAELSDEIKEAIVLRIARYEQPTAIAKAVGEEFGITISRDQVAHYNPTLASFKASQRWVYVFDAERARWTNEAESHDITKTGYRVARLQRMSEAAERSGNMVLAAALLKQAAEDYGGSYSNTRQLQHTGSIEVRKQITPAEARMELAQRIAALKQLPASEQIIDQKD